METENKVCQAPDGLVQEGQRVKWFDITGRGYQGEVENLVKNGTLVPMLKKVKSLTGR